MGTRAVVAVPYGDGWRGRYVHWSGEPDYLRPRLYAVMARDGYARAVEVLTGEHFGWSDVTGAEDVTLREGYDDGRFCAVPGYGVAYTEANGVDADSWLGPDPESLAGAWIEWAYVLTPDGIATYAVDADGIATPHREPTP